MDRRVKRRVENPCEVFQVSLKWRMFPRFCSVRCVNSSFFLFFQFFFFFLLYIQLVDSSSFFFVLHLRYGLKLLFFGIPYVLKRDACLVHHVWILRLTIDRTARIIRGLLATCEETVNETTNFFFFFHCVIDATIGRTFPARWSLKIILSISSQCSICIYTLTN